MKTSHFHCSIPSIQLKHDIAKICRRFEVGWCVRRGVKGSR